jgi:SAM-dependent methyltransferase
VAEHGDLGSAGFARGADVYERARPGYPIDLVALLAGRAQLVGGVVLDVAAGTGKFTRQLATAGGRCVALEPSAAMRAMFVVATPGVPMVDAGAEAIPATAAAFDLVTVAQAFHWFDAPVALAEIARVLRPGGMLALIWNEREESDPVMAEFSRIISWDERRPLRDVAHYSPAIERTGLFHAPEHHRFGHIERVSRQTLVEMAASRSYVNVMESEERAGVLGRIGELAASLAEPIAIPYVTEVYTARVLARP